MQGFSSANMPLSRVTVGSLADLGYVVDLEKADPFTFAGALSASPWRGLPLHGPNLGNDVAETDIWGVDRTGRRTLLRSERNPLGRN